MKKRSKRKGQRPGCPAQDAAAQRRFTAEGARLALARSRNTAVRELAQRAQALELRGYERMAQAAQHAVPRAWVGSQPPVRKATAPGNR